MKLLAAPHRLLLPAESSGSLIGHVHQSDIFDLCERVYRAGVLVDMILCDLPYQVTGLKWDKLIPFDPMWKWFKRIVKPNGAIVLTAQQPFTSALVMSNPRMFKYEWVWVKQHPKGFLDARRKPMNDHETVLVFCQLAAPYYPQGLVEVNVKNGRKNKSGGGVYGKVGNPDYVQTTGNFPRSVLNFDAVTHDNVHPTQKPVALFDYLIRTYTQVNDVVFDPCAGSGTTAVAARGCNRRYIVGDREQKYVNVMRERLAAPYQLDMFYHGSLTA